MKTNTKLIEKVLIILSEQENSNNKDSKISLEVALDKAETQTGFYLEEGYADIRLFLRNKELINHNPRLTILNQHQGISDNIGFVYKEVHKDFIVDYVTEKCFKLIDNKSLLQYLQE